MSDAVPRGFRRIGEQRVREVLGLSFEEFTIGLVVEHRPARTVTDVEHVQILRLMGNEAPIHSDIEFCERAGHGQVLVCGILSLTIVLGMTVRSTSGMTSGNIALDEVRFENPVHIGDTLRAQSTVLAVRRANSRDDQGIVTCRIEGHNQLDQRVLSCTRTFYVPADTNAFRDPAGY